MDGGQLFERELVLAAASDLLDGVRWGVVRGGGGGHASVQRLVPLSEDASAVLAARLGGPVAETVSRTAAGLCAGNPLLLEPHLLGRVRYLARHASGPDAGHAAHS